MGVVLPPLEFTECLNDSPHFRENLHKHERELEKTNQHIKRIIKEVKDLIAAATQLSDAQKSFGECMKSFTFECIGGTETDDEAIIFSSLKVFSECINTVEEERQRMLDNAVQLVVKPLEEFRKKQIGAVKNEKKKFEKQTAKFCQNQERYLNMTTKKTNSLQEADASVDMAERHFYKASMEYVYLIQQVHERKKFEFVETLLQFMLAWLTFYHQGYEVAKDSQAFTHTLSQKIQKTRSNFDDFSHKLKFRMDAVLKLEEPVRNVRGMKQGYLYLLEKKAFGNTWSKHYCKYSRDTKQFSMMPYNQLTTKSLPTPEQFQLSSCVRRMTDSIDKRFCFDLQTDSKPGVTLTFQALSEQDRKAWMDIMEGIEPTYTAPSRDRKTPNPDEHVLDEAGFKFVKKCIEVLEIRGLEEQGLYRVGGVSSKVNKMIQTFLDKKKTDKVSMLDPLEWETKTITSALKTYIRSFSEPLMTYQLHGEFLRIVKQETKDKRLNEIHKLLYKLPKDNFELLKIVIKHLRNIADKHQKNLMTSSNLSVVFGPTMMRPEEETVASIMDLKFCNIVVEIMIDNYELFFTTEPLMTKPVEEQPQVVENMRKRFNQHNGHVPTYSVSSPVHNSSKRNGYSPEYTQARVQQYTPPKPIYSNIRFEASYPGADDFPDYLHRPAATSNRYLSAAASSQSETNITNMNNFKAPRYGSQSILETNCTSSSNESVASTSAVSPLQIPRKSERSNLPPIGSYQKPYKSPDNVRVRTLYACLGENDGELSFEPNQIITNVKTSSEPGWLEGTLNGKTGLVPENYVEILP